MARLFTRQQHERLRMHVGQMIASWRCDRQLTQAELAKRVGINRVTVANIELGVWPCSLRLSYQLAQALEVELTDILPSVRRVFNGL